MLAKPSAEQKIQDQSESTPCSDFTKPLIDLSDVPKQSFISQVRFEWMETIIEAANAPGEDLCAEQFGKLAAEDRLSADLDTFEAKYKCYKKQSYRHPLVWAIYAVNRRIVLKIAATFFLFTQAKFLVPMLSNRVTTYIQAPPELDSFSDLFSF